MTPESDVSTPPNASHWPGFGFILLLALGLRLFALDTQPTGLFRDELEKGYSAWSIANEGGVLEFTADPAQPMNWHAWPGLINVVGVKTSAIYQYAAAPVVKVTGLTPFAVRLPAAIVGALAVALLGLLFMRVWSAPVGLCVMFCLAVMPWHFTFSRWALQGIFVPFGMVIVLAGLAGAEARRAWGFVVAGFGLGFIFYSYSGAEPFVLAWGLALVVFMRTQLVSQWKSALAGLVLFLVMALPRVAVILFAEGGARLQSEAVWNAPDATVGLTAWRVVSSYLLHFTPEFLLMTGDSIPRHNLTPGGQLLALDVVFLPVGLFMLIRDRRPLCWAIVSAIALGPIGAAITWGHQPHALRAFPMALPLAICCGLGLWVSANWLAGRIGAQDVKRQTLVRVCVLAAAALFAVGHFAGFFRISPDDPNLRHAFAADEQVAFMEVAAQRTPDQKVYVQNFNYAFYFPLFYDQLAPQEVLLDGLEAHGYYILPPTTGPDQLRRVMRPGDWFIGFGMDGRVQAVQNNRP